MIVTLTIAATLGVLGGIWAINNSLKKKTEQRYIESNRPTNRELYLGTSNYYDPTPQYQAQSARSYYPPVAQPQPTYTPPAPTRSSGGGMNPLVAGGIGMLAGAALTEGIEELRRRDDDESTNSYSNSSDTTIINNYYDSGSSYDYSSSSDSSWSSCDSGSSWSDSSSSCDSGSW